MSFVAHGEAGWVFEGIAPAGGEDGQADDESDEEPEIHPGEQGVVPEIAELGDAAFLLAGVADGSGEVGDRHAAPGEADGDFRIEVEAAGEAGGLHHGEEVCGGIEAHAEE